MITEKLGKVVLTQALTVATEVAMDVGNLLRDYLENPNLHSQRSHADLKAERLIRRGLSSPFPTWGFRAEEEPDLNILTSPDIPFWLVDPNDGTSAFLQGERGASISIALIYQHRPILGIIYAYAAPNGYGDLFTWAEMISPLKRNGQEVKPNWSESWNEATICVSNSADRISEAYQHVLNSEGQVGCQYRVAPGIAYRLALCAVGEGEVAISLASPRDFDFAAGHALLIGAGGDLLDGQGKSVRYDHERPARLGFAFGGQRTLALKATTLDWNPTILAQRTPVKTPFLAPNKVPLCRQKQLLNSIQGAWWGWHYGSLMERLETKEQDELIPSIRDHGGDAVLIKESRSFCKGERDYAELPRLQKFVNCLCDRTERVKRSGYPGTPLEGVLWGKERGRNNFDAKVVSAFLSWRRGTIDEWQPDGDRLAECLLGLLPQLKTV